MLNSVYIRLPQEEDALFTWTCISYEFLSTYFAFALSDSSYWSHAGLHSTGWEESGSAAQLPPRFPQVSVIGLQTSRDLSSDGHVASTFILAQPGLEQVHQTEAMKSIFYEIWLFGSILWQIDVMLWWIIVVEEVFRAKVSSSNKMTWTTSKNGESQIKLIIATEIFPRKGFWEYVSKKQSELMCLSSVGSELWSLGALNSKSSTTLHHKGQLWGSSSLNMAPSADLSGWRGHKMYFRAMLL